MKIRKGESIACGQGHHVGYLLTDVPEGMPVTADALWILSPFKPGQGYRCDQCEEVVALLENGDRWRVRTARGWIS